MYRQMSRAQREAAFLEKAAQMYGTLEDWYDQHPEASFGEIITLEGYTLAPAGDGLAVTLFWRAVDSPQVDYTTFVHVVDAAGEIVAQADAQPRQGRYPTSIWSPGELVVDELAVGAIPPGEYQVYVGWYRWDTLERLPVTSGEAESTDGRLLLGPVELP